MIHKVSEYYASILLLHSFQWYFVLSFSCVFPGRYYSILEFQMQDMVVQNAVEASLLGILGCERQYSFHFRLSNVSLGLSWSLLLQYSGVSEAGPGGLECC